MSKKSHTRIGGLIAAAASTLLAGLVPCACDGTGGLPPGVVPTDEVAYVGSNACGSCHAGVGATHARTGHAHALKAVQGAAPEYPAPAAGVPEPPIGFGWDDISYVVDGYQKAALFVDFDGFVLTNGTTGVDSLYNLTIPAIAATAGFTPFRPAQADPLPLVYEDFWRRTTGTQDLASNGGRRQDNRAGIEGTWAQPGVQCEACHGPGSLHVPNPSAGNINLDADSMSCSKCHASGTADAIDAANELITGFQQAEEVAVSPHQAFSCTVCHDPHASAQYDPDAGIRNQCGTCHAGHDMGLHEGFVYRRGDYAEPLTCVSCHMPYAVKSLTTSDVQLSNDGTVRLGDTRSHIMLLDATPDSRETMFSAGGTSVTVGADGRAAVSTCYVCQRCHNGQGNAFAFPADQGCAFGEGIHGNE